MPDSADRATPRARERDILRLAVPAFLTLVAEPLFLLADSAIIGHLGTPELAGLGVASAALLSVVGLFVFLAYSTTAVVSRQTGAGAPHLALAAGLDGLWLALGLGAVVTVAVATTAPALCSVFGASPAAIAHATTYLRISAFGLPAMFASLALTGILRGLQDTKTPLKVSVQCFTWNIVLNFVFVYGLGMGIAGSALGTVLAQTAMALGLGVVVYRHARGYDARLRPQLGGILHAAADGFPLLIRTMALRAVLLVTTWSAAGFGDTTLAAYQVTSTVWSFLAFALDALAIAGQALTGRALGAGDVQGAREATRIMTRWGVGAGVVLGALVLAVHQVLPALFTPDEAVRTVIAAGLVMVALSQPVNGYAFVLDGVLIGAGDSRWLAGAQVGLLVAYLPMIAWLNAHTSSLSADQTQAITALWCAMAAFMILRAVVLGLRARSDGWAVTGTRASGH
ncbi:MAG: MATE family efflux transporter [Austwickia sp.]|jgi:putative MATE family efflux protein|nr:MATE family efflux transporter [Austwickia sp.]MBK9102595.1 MATE family efflux transporter [Austwickia sp.]